VFEDITKRVIGCAIEVHRHLGPGLLESVYQQCFSLELRLSGIAVQHQVAVPIIYKGQVLASALRLDLLVENAVIVEVKAVQKIEPVFEAQLLSYLRLAKLRVGLLVNFNVGVMHEGIRRISN
jgi:GxxExxY protein